MNVSPAILQVDALPSPLSATVGSAATRGAMWTLLFSLLTKIVTLGSQIALAWFLVPEEFGLVAMTLSVMSFTAAVGSGNLRTILVQRFDRFNEEAGQVFWLALFLNFGAALFLAVFSPLAGILFQEPRVMALILVATLAPPIQSLSTIYTAALQRDLRFQRVAMIQCAAGAVQNGSAVLLAWSGAGALSLVLPLTISAIWMAVAYRLSAGRIALGRPNLRAWRPLRTPMLWLMTNALFSALLASGASVAVGLVQHDPRTLGFYYWGFSISSQAVFLLVNNLQGVMFPALNKLNADSERQFVAVEKSARTLLLIVTPVCLLQWLLAEPLVSWLFGGHWNQAIPVVEGISVGLLSQPLYLLTVSVLLARGRFRKLALTSGFVAVVTVGSATISALSGDPATIARYVGYALLVSNIVAGWVTLREFDRGWRHLSAVIKPFALMAISVGALGWWTNQITHVAGTVIQVAATSFIVVTGYACLAKYLLPQVADDVAIRLAGRPVRSRTSIPSGALQP